MIKKIACVLIVGGIYSFFVMGESKKYPSVKEKTVTKEGIMFPQYSHPYKWNSEIKGDTVLFDELWGYVLLNRLKDYNDKTPLTDIGLFSAEINSYGELVGIPKRSVLGSNFKGKVHLVTVCEGTSLSHLAINPKYGHTDKIIKGLLDAMDDFDGLQVDWELVPKKDADNFILFLKKLKKGLGNKPLTVCVPARTKTLQKDVYDYKKIGKIADRIMIMAYDEHWSGSSAGSIASISWCEKIADYAKTIYPTSKYIMGLPFYGRIWGSESVKGAFAFNGMNRLAHEHGVVKIERKDGVPYYTYKAEVTVTGWYEDAHSIVERSRMYKSKGYDNIAFWRMGHEDAAVWEWIGNKTSGTKAYGYVEN